MLNLFLILFGLILLAKGADILIEGALGFSKKLGVSELFTGLTLVAFGTSAPELVVGISASLNNSGIALGNVLGSNVSNIALILGMAVLIKPAPMGKSTMKFEMPFLIIISTVISSMIIEDSSVISRFDGLILISFLLIFIIYLYMMAKNDKEVQNQLLEDIKDDENDEMGWTKIILLSSIGIIMLAIGGDLTVNNSIKLARIIGISESLIGVTIVAVGTSLPELVTAIAASKKGSNDILLGNIIGSNIFNILTIVGISSLINDIKPDRGLTFDAFYSLILAIILLFGTLLSKKKKVGRPLGFIFILMYIFYIYQSIVLG
ncbi:calcium/sodium antiporter [Oceanotoga sp. DSM 15011]|uniref:calcium/sodium antiporter n=1 Tax=Oceanotoga sp. DSM 15011 TaxID=2984951 RepID=UPI0021F48124|nr:calcium/sodium antiporter [Oceanotoga sp. DSM 15011]UYP00230.1 calcium/sodium antiporter [Oceanotoga sp. DSM 15011]